MKSIKYFVLSVYSSTTLCDWVITRFTEDSSRSLTRLSALLPSADTFHILWAVAFALLFHFTSPSVDVLVHHPLIHTYFHIVILISLQLSNPVINVKNFHGSLTTVVRAQNDTPKTANITDTIFDRTLVLPLQATAFCFMWGLLSPCRTSYAESTWQGQTTFQISASYLYASCSYANMYFP